MEDKKDNKKQTSKSDIHLRSEEVQELMGGDSPIGPADRDYGDICHRHGPVGSLCIHEMPGESAGRENYLFKSYDIGENI